MKRNTAHPAAPAADLGDAEALHPEASAPDVPSIELLPETMTSVFGLCAESDDFLFAVRSGQPSALAISEAQTLLSAVRRRLQEPMLERIGGDEAHLLGFAVGAAVALYHAAGASE